MNFIPLSWSRLSVYRQCPAKFEAQYISKDYPDEGDNPAFAKGKAIHKQLEDYIIWKTDPDGEMPKQGGPAQNAHGIVNKLFDACGVVYPEKQIALNQDWQKCSWFDKPTTVKFRVIIDALAFNNTELIALDFKSGKVRDYDEDYGQLHLTAAILLALYPNVTQVSCHYLFVEHKQTISITIKREDLCDLQQQFDNEHTQVGEDTDFLPKKNKYCFFCGIKEDCKYG